MAPLDAPRYATDVDIIEMTCMRKLSDAPTSPTPSTFDCKDVKVTPLSSVFRIVADWPTIIATDELECDTEFSRFDTPLDDPLQFVPLSEEMNISPLDPTAITLLPSKVEIP
jgi:hypothetical protein